MFDNQTGNLVAHSYMKSDFFQFPKLTPQIFIFRKPINQNGN